VVSGEPDPDSSRRKLVSDVNWARNVTASGTLRSRAGAAAPGWACVKVLMGRTLGASRHAGKGRFHGD
jgi:hypothetical protein